jgi:hypothetical protein
MEVVSGLTMNQYGKIISISWYDQINIASEE